MTVTRLRDYTGRYFRLLGWGLFGGTTPSNAYVAEDGVTFYVAEDGTTYYVAES